jgi:hypothetical protein
VIARNLTQAKAGLRPGTCFHGPLSRKFIERRVLTGLAYGPKGQEKLVPRCLVWVIAKLTHVWNI